jgi:diketogulonate reductase-like aldo/keto reductase
MRRRQLGRSASEVSLIGQGTWELELSDEAAVTRALHEGIALGLTHIDTAEMYGAGRVEELLGRALAGRREQVFLTSKVLPTNASRRGTVRACERSLQRLGTDHLDLYLLHWPGAHPLAETIAAFEELVAAGKIRHYGLSNFDAAGLEQAVALAGPGCIACDQVLYHLAERALEHRLLPTCARLGVTLVAYSPFGSERGRFPGPRTSGGRILAEIAVAHGATPRQVALAFLVRNATLVTIPKAARLEHVRENAGAGELALNPDEIARLEAAFPLGPEPRELPMI